MRRVFGNDDHIALGDGLGVSAFDARAGEVFGVGPLFVRQLAARDQRSRAIQHVEHLGFTLVNGSRANAGPVFEIGVVRGQVQDVLDDGRLAVFMVGLRFGARREFAGLILGL